MSKIQNIHTISSSALSRFEYSANSLRVRLASGITATASDGRLKAMLASSQFCCCSSNSKSIHCGNKQIITTQLHSNRTFNVWLYSASNRLYGIKHYELSICCCGLGLAHICIVQHKMAFKSCVVSHVT